MGLMFFFYFFCLEGGDLLGDLFAGFSSLLGR